METSDSNKEKQAFYSLDEYPEFKWLASQYAVILDELNKNNFWMDWGSDNYDPIGHCKFLNGNWTVCPVYFGRYSPYSLNIPGTVQFNQDELIRSLPEKFPRTIELLKTIDRINFSAFSRLHPNSSLAAHQHNNPDSLIFHLGLVIPQGKSCGLQVDDKTHIWNKPGDAIIFNDNMKHAAWNHSDQERIIFYVDFAR